MNLNAMKMMIYNNSTDNSNFMEKFLKSFTSLRLKITTYFLQKMNNYEKLLHFHNTIALTSGRRGNFEIICYHLKMFKFIVLKLKSRSLYR